MSHHNTKHGMFGTSIYRRWGAMIQRCMNPNDAAWPDYGGRRIMVCVRWRTFANFYADMGDPPEGLTLDRIDNDGPYCLDNCQWASRSEQSINRRKNRGCTSKYTGVCWDKEKRRWAATISINGKNKRLGRYLSEEEAAQAYRVARGFRC